MVDQPLPRGAHVSRSNARRLPAAGGVLLAASPQTGGHFSVIRAAAPPGDSTPLHRHLTMDESFCVLAGSYEVTCGDDVFKVAEGDFVYLPRGVPHKYVAGPEGGEKLIIATPGGLETFFEDLAAGMDPATLGRKHQIEFLE